MMLGDKLSLTARRFSLQSMIAKLLSLDRRHSGQMQVQAAAVRIGSISDVLAMVGSIHAQVCPAGRT
jgi:hypothetical protein